MSERETAEWAQMLRLVLAGRSPKEVAEQLGIEEEAVMDQFREILRRLVEPDKPDRLH